MLHCKRGGGRAWHLFFLPLEVSAKTEVTGVEISLSPLLDCPKKLSQPLARQSVLQEGTLDSKSHSIPSDGPLSSRPLARCLGLFFCPCFILFPSLLFPGALLLSYVEDLTFALGSAFWGSQANLTSTWETPVDGWEITKWKRKHGFSPVC